MIFIKTKRKLLISRLAAVLAVLVFIAILASCNISYLTQAAAGHFRIMNSRKSIKKILKDDQLDIKTRNSLEMVLDIHDFAIRELGLPDNKSYTLYSELKEDYPGWNVYCAPKFSIEPKTWCFPVAGCVVYHGYFKKEKAIQFADKMEKEGYDVYVAPFSAYSTLGWYNDPILSTHLRYDSIRLAGLIIHELAHQKLYVKGDSQFNESFAVTVEQAGVLKWLESLGRKDQMAKALKNWNEEQEFIERILKARKDLNSIFISVIDSMSMLHQKDSILQKLQSDLNFGENEINNAYFIPVSTYNSLVPEFQNIFDSCGGNFQKFYKKMEKLIVIEP